MKHSSIFSLRKCCLESGNIWTHPYRWHVANGTAIFSHPCPLWAQSAVVCSQYGLPQSVGSMISMSHQSVIDGLVPSPRTTKISHLLYQSLNTLVEFLSDTECFSFYWIMICRGHSVDLSGSNLPGLSGNSGLRTDLFNTQLHLEILYQDYIVKQY